MKFSFDQFEFIEQDKDSVKTAIAGDDFSISWADFELRVNSMIRTFEEKNLTSLKYPVILYGHKSANMLVCMYALMKLKICYVPADIIYPHERLSKVIQISNAQVILNTTIQSLKFDHTTEFLIDSKSQLISIQELKKHEKSEALRDPLVYTIFTSGSTGEPKGVQISREAVQSFVRWMTSDFGFNSDSVFINTAILSFDLSVFEVMTFSALGSTLVLTAKECSSTPQKFLQHIQQNSGTVLVATPSFALAYARMKNSPELSSLKSFLFCGEVLPNSTAKNLRESFPAAKIINTYGPTEATVATTIVEITNEIINQFDPLPVGVSKPESELFIEEGEIVIAGPNVSMGYLNSPELNAVKFVTRKGQRAFKTGDTGYLQNGMLFFNGRNDDLVKLHGYRIELNEITAALNNLPYIANAATIGLKREGIVKKIVSLVHLISDTNSISVQQVKDDLSKTLPHYMIPSDIKFLEQIPLNANGKADKKLLEAIYLA